MIKLRTVTIAAALLLGGCLWAPAAAGGDGGRHAAGVVLA